jgi:CotH kinase protein/Lamin Tail Domain
MNRNLPFLVAFVAMTAMNARGGDVVISEIMYHPASENPQEEYIELLNTGTGAVDLNGWRFKSGVQFTFTNVSILPGAYLAVASDLAVFRNKYPSVNNVVGGWRGRLGNSDEKIELEDALGREVDSLHYANEGDWGIRRRGPTDHLHQGWTWVAEHDGGGKSLELINPSLPNKHGQNWQSSITLQGTPGRVNSVARDNIAPLIFQVSHYPVIPKSTDTVAVTARFLDEQATGVTASVHYRVDGNAAFSVTAMLDDGAHGDGVAGDGFHGAILPAQGDGVIVEFYVEVGDLEGNTRTWPAPVQPAGTHSANLLYQVRDTVDTGPQPLYLLIMKEVERDELDYIGDTLPDALSDAEMNGTFISVDDLGTTPRYTVGIRNRGHGSRTARPNNYHVNFPNDWRWKGLKAINLNAQFTHAQLAGSILFRKSGIPAAVATAVQVRVNNADLAGAGSPQFGSYVALESLNSDFTENHFPNDSSGNLYRASAAESPSTAEAELAYRGADPNSYTNTYFKETNQSEDDWSDIIELTRVLSDTPDNLYLAEVKRVVDVHEWLRFFAMNALLDNNETGIYMGYGDDYSMYRGMSDARLLLLPHDLDTIMGEGNDSGTTTASIFRATDLPSVERFLKGPEFLPLYYAHLRGMMETTFSAEQLHLMLEQALDGFVPSATISRMEDFTAARNAYVLSILPNLIPVTSTWKYNESGTDLGTGWREVTYNDGSWLSGPALLYHETASLPAPKRTPLTLGSTTYYFRTRFVLNPAFTIATSGLKIKLATVIDDGAVFYLNGAEIFRLAMPEGPIDYSTLATRAVGDAIWEGFFTIPPDHLVTGTNLLAVEVHQTDPTSSDVVFGMTLDLAIEPVSTVPSEILINEVMANNVSDPDETGSPSDWLELYNRSSNPVDLSDTALSDNIDLPRKWTFPPSSIIPANGFVTVRCDSGQAVTRDNTGFSLKKSGDQVYFFDKPAHGGRLLDSIAFGLQAADFTIGRVPNGSPTWVLANPTKASGNTSAPLGNPAALRINEWMASPTEGDDWFELRNPESNPVSLGGFHLSDSLVNRTESRIPDLSFLGVGAQGYQAFVADGSPSKGADHADFKLSASGESIALFTSEGVMIDGVTFGAQQPGVSQGRYPNGSASIVFFPGSETPGRGNSLASKPRITHEANNVLIHFYGAAGGSYTVQYRDSLSSGGWIPLQTVFPATNGPVEVMDTIFAGHQSRFYRLVTPSIP